MATKKAPVKERMRLIDPVYKKFTARAFQTMTSADFYDYFMATMSRGAHQFQFSNRKIDKRVDERWVEEIEIALPAMEAISRDPRIIITQEELITNVMLVKKVTSQVVTHLCSHANLVESISDDGEVRPSKLLNLYKEESWETYENRFAYTLIKKTFDFVDLRYQKLFEQMDDEFGAHLMIDSKASTALETINVNMDMRINQIDDLLATDGKHETIFSRIARIHRVLQTLLTSRFAKELSKYSQVRPPLVPTNAIKKNPYLRKCHKLWDFLLVYTDIGYSIEIIEQNPDINTKFEQDIFNNIMFNYIILKGYLEDNRDRAIDYKMKAKKKQLKPKYIKEILEEFVKDYDMPDVEVRKVLIEELTKAQLMQEEENERLRLVEEKEREMKEKQRLEELEQARIKREEEKQARRLAREQERERVRQQKAEEAEKIRLQKEQERLEAHEARLGALYAKEIGALQANIEPFLANRDKVRKHEEEARIKAEKARIAAIERAKREKAAEERRAKRSAEALERKRLEEEERIRKEAEAKAKLAEEKARLQAEKKAQQETAAAARKLERERARAEKLAQQAADAAAKLESERIALQEQARQEQERIEQERVARLESQQKLAEEERRIREETTRKLEQERQALIQQEEDARQARLQQAKAQREAEQLQLQEIERIVELRTKTEFAQSGLGHGKNVRIKKKLESKFREDIREEELIKAGLKAAPVVVAEPEPAPIAVQEPMEEPVQDVPQELATEQSVEAKSSAEVEETAKPATPKPSFMGALGKQWKKWRK